MIRSKTKKKNSWWLRNGDKLQSRPMFYLLRMLHRFNIQKEELNKLWRQIEQ